MRVECDCGVVSIRWSKLKKVLAKQLGVSLEPRDFPYPVVQLLRHPTLEVATRIEKLRRRYLGGGG
jgi:hypothetical protein